MASWAALAGLIAMVGALSGAPGLLLVAALTLGYAGLTAVWTRFGTDRLEYGRRLGTERAVAGDTVPLDITLCLGAHHVEPGRVRVRPLGNLVERLRPQEYAPTSVARLDPLIRYGPVGL